jgi:TonB family protein
MNVAALLVIAASAQSPPPPTDCATAIARGTSPAAAQICLAEAELAKAQAIPKTHPEWSKRLQAAAEHYKRAFALPADDVIKTASIERLLVIFDVEMLNDSSEMTNAFRELVTLKPTEADPLFHYATYQESQGAIDAAEETLLTARRLQPNTIEPLQMLARFYARRAGALHASAEMHKPQENTPPGSPDKDGIYQVGGSLTPPRRFGNPVFPVEAQAAGIDGVVVAEITVSDSGLVTDARVLKSNPLLDDAALKAVREWRYDPTIVDGRAVPVKMTVTVNFSLRR